MPDTIHMPRFASLQILMFTVEKCGRQENQNEKQQQQQLKLR